MAAYIINENDIFKYFASENPNLGSTLAQQNMRLFLGEVPLNIFHDEFYILYEVVAVCNIYDTTLNTNSLYQILNNNRDDIIQSPKVSLADSQGLSEADRFDAITDIVMSVYADYMDTPDLDESQFNGNVRFYLNSWADTQYTQLNYDLQTIMDSGLQVGPEVTRGLHHGKFFKGREDANTYYRVKWNIISSLVNQEGSLTGGSINTAEQSGAEIFKAMMEENNEAPLGGLGVTSVDSVTGGIFKGEITVIQAGSGVGKTRLTVGTTANILNNGYNTLYISLEQKESRIMPMFIARHILDTQGDYDIVDSNIIRQDFSMKNRSVVEEATNDLSDNPKYGRLRIEYLDLRATEMLDQLNRLWDDFKFDVVVIDYIGLLSIVDNRYTEITDCINVLKNACKTFKGEGFALILPHQLSKESERELLAGNDEAGRTGGSESQYIFRAADVVLTLFQSAEMKEDSDMKIIFSKGRLGEAAPCIIHSDMGRCFYSEKPISTDESRKAFGVTDYK